MPSNPLCVCGCGRPVKRRFRTKGQPTRYYSRDCVPVSVRAEAGRKGRLQYIIDTRLARFGRELKRLQAMGRIAAPELVATFAAIEQRGWDYGYQACESKWNKRRRRQAA